MSKMYACANVSFMFKETGSLLSRYKSAAEAGFRFVESDFPQGITVSNLGKVVKESGVKQVLINCFQGNDGQMGFGATPGCQKEFQNSLETTIEYAQAVDCKKIHILSGMDLGSDKKSDQIIALKENLKWAAERLSKEDMIGVIEPINSYSKPGYFLNNYEDAVAVLENVSSPHIRLQLDLFHLQMITGNVTNNIKRLLPFTGHVQVAQAPNRHEPSFSGELNMRYVFSELEKAGYNGPIGCEYFPSGSSIDSLGWIKEYGLSF